MSSPYTVSDNCRAQNRPLTSPYQSVSSLYAEKISVLTLHFFFKFLLQTKTEAFFPKKMRLKSCEYCLFPTQILDLSLCNQT